MTGGERRRRFLSLVHRLCDFLHNLELALYATTFAVPLSSRVSTAYYVRFCFLPFFSYLVLDHSNLSWTIYRTTLPWRAVDLLQSHM